jgi:hypothetical protein
MNNRKLDTKIFRAVCEGHKGQRRWVYEIRDEQGQLIVKEGGFFSRENCERQLHLMLGDIALDAKRAYDLPAREEVR